jgi:hypothetical protein
MDGFDAALDRARAEHDGDTGSPLTIDEMETARRILESCAYLEGTGQNLPQEFHAAFSDLCRCWVEAWGAVEYDNERGDQ